MSYSIISTFKRQTENGYSFEIEHLSGSPRRYRIFGRDKSGRSLSGARAMETFDDLKRGFEIIAEWAARKE